MTRAPLVVEVGGGEDSLGGGRVQGGSGRCGVVARDGYRWWWQRLTELGGLSCHGRCIADNQKSFGGTGRNGGGRRCGRRVVGRAGGGGAVACEGGGEMRMPGAV
jgi:hypothetical protein